MLRAVQCRDPGSSILHGCRAAAFCTARQSCRQRLQQRHKLALKHAEHAAWCACSIGVSCPSAGCCDRCSSLHWLSARRALHTWSCLTIGRWSACIERWCGKQAPRPHIRCCKRDCSGMWQHARSGRGACHSAGRCRLLLLLLLLARQRPQCIHFSLHSQRVPVALWVARDSAACALHPGAVASRTCSGAANRLLASCISNMEHHPKPSESDVPCLLHGFAGMGQHLRLAAFDAGALPHLG